MVGRSRDMDGDELTDQRPEMEQLRLTTDTGARDVPDRAYLTIAEAARRVHCCERTVRRAIDSGALRAGKIGGRRGSRGGYRIRPADLDAWV